MWRVLARLGVQSRDVPDACQETFLIVHRRLADYDPAQSALRGWMYGICLRVASDYRRRHPSRHEVSEPLTPPAVDAPQESALETARAWAKLAKTLDGMDSGKREVFVLYELEAVSMNEIAQILGCPVQTAYARLHAARRLVLGAFESQETP